MHRNRLAVATLLALAGASFGAAAVEGMWVPQQLPDIAGPLKKAGLKLNARQLADLTGDPMGAVVSLGGCTASFVSPDGLVVTNHHCAYGAIQLNSTPQQNLIETGFNARDARGGTVRRAERAHLRAGVDPGRDQAGAGRDRRRTGRARPHARAGGAGEVAGGGLRVRRRGIAAGSTASRAATPTACSRTSRSATCAWSTRRRAASATTAARSTTGCGRATPATSRSTAPTSARTASPAAYAADNVPFRPKHFLKIADKPLGEGDFVMVAGYPGSTSRYALASEFDATANWTYPTVGQHYKNLVAMVEAAGRRNPDVAVKYAATVRGWQNALKNYDGQLEGFRRIGAGERKGAEEEAVLEWLRRQGARGQAGLAAHERLQQLGEEARAHRERDLAFGQLRSTGVLGAAMQLYRTSIERDKPDAQREAGYQQRDLPSLEGAMRQMERRYQPQMDRELHRLLAARVREAAPRASTSPRSTPGSAGPMRRRWTARSTGCRRRSWAPRPRASRCSRPIARRSRSRRTRPSSSRWR